MQPFRDRKEAGQRLAGLLRGLAREHPLVLALPRGGVPVAHEVARALAAPLDVLIVRKLGAPSQPELGVGALAEDGTVYVDEESCAALRISGRALGEIAAREKLEIERRVGQYRGGRALPEVSGRTVILVDDGIATGGSARAAARALRHLGAAKIVLAVPVAAVEAVEQLSPEVDQLVSVITPERLVAVGQWYDDFHQVGDGEVMALLGVDDPRHRQVRIPVKAGELIGDLVIPPQPIGLVLFAHGSGSSRLSPRNRSVAEWLHQAGLATLLVDLLTAKEDEQDSRWGELRFDVHLLAKRLVRVIEALPADVRSLPLGLFGASTGAAAALVAAGASPHRVQAVVSRGGRPDLAGAHLYDVQAPTLFIVGGRDEMVLELNRDAMARMRCERQLIVVPGATHLFEEPGTLDQAAHLARAWFEQHLRQPGAAEFMRR